MMILLQVMLPIVIPIIIGLIYFGNQKSNLEKALEETDIDLNALSTVNIFASRKNYKVFVPALLFVFGFIVWLTYNFIDLEMADDSENIFLYIFFIVIILAISFPAWYSIFQIERSLFTKQPFLELTETEFTCHTKACGKKVSFLWSDVIMFRPYTERGKTASGVAFYFADNVGDDSGTPFDQLNFSIHSVDVNLVEFLRLAEANTGLKSDGLEQI